MLSSDSCSVRSIPNPRLGEWSARIRSVYVNGSECETRIKYAGE